MSPLLPSFNEYGSTSVLLCLLEDFCSPEFLDFPVGPLFRRPLSLKEFVWSARRAKLIQIIINMLSDNEFFRTYSN